MKLEQIGFYTLSDDRAVNASPTSPLWRCELILTDKCNFMCPYCRGLRSDVSGEMDFSFAMSIVREWCDQGLRNVRFSGGEPMLYSGLASLVHYCKSRGVERIAISTNGSASKEMYTEMIDAGVTDFSVSLDACCSAVADRMSGYSGAWDTVVENIKWLAERQYTTVGIVVNRENIATCLGTILLADSLGVSDIRVISAAQYDQLLTNLAELPDKVLKKYPILDYRVSNIRSGRHVRGLRPGDSDRCWLALDDMAVAGRYHFPCIIYLREQGDPIGKIGPGARRERELWAKNHNCRTDPICLKNCLDVCVDYNNKCEEMNSFIKKQKEEGVRTWTF